MLRLVLPLLLAATLAVAGCTSPEVSSVPAQSAYSDVVLTRIAFGSCNQQDAPQPFWPVIGQHNPQLWVWLGDNIYGDTRNMRVLAQKYDVQEANANYRQFVADTRVVGTWDDHDYGKNDAGRFYPKRDSSQQLFLNFMDVPQDHPRREREGVYSVHTYGPPGRRVKVILLDTRYHRDSLATDPDPNRRYQPRPNGDILGEAQWAWLERVLRTSEAQLHLIGSSIQVIPEQHGWEKWANFPEARQRLFRVLRETGVPGVILLSGDRHMAEISRLDDVVGYPLYEVTASGLTHSWGGSGFEPNRHRVDSLFTRRNYGFMQIDWNAEPATVTLQVHAIEGDSVAVAETVSLDALQPASGG